MATVRVTSVVPSRYWAPESTSSSEPRFDALGQPLGRPVVDDGAVGGRAGDGVEREVLQRAGGLAEALQLGRPPRARRAGWPGASVATQCRKRVSAAPSRMCAWRAPSISTAFLQARGRAVGSARAHAPRRRRRSSASKYQADDCAGIDQHALAGQLASAPASSSGASSLTPLPSQAGSSGVTLAGSRNSRADAVGVEDRLRQRQRRADHVAAADVEQPGDRGRRGDHAPPSAPCSARLSPTRARLAAEASPANSSGCGTTGRLGWAGRAAPQAASSGLGSTGFSAAPALAAAVSQPLQRVGAVQPRVVADGPARAWPRSPGRPARRRRPGRGSRTGPCRPGRAPAGCSGRRRRSPPCPSGSPPRRPSR